MSVRVPSRRAFLCLAVAVLVSAAAAGAASRALPQQSGSVDLLAQANLQIDGAATDDRAGLAVSSAGDVNRDDLADVILGAPSADNNGRANSGSAYVVFGKASPTAVDLAALGDGGFRIDGAAASDAAGFAVGSAGDVNGDGRSDVIVGAYGADNNGRADSGSAYVVFGKASTTVVDLAALGDGGFRVDGAAATDAAGYEVGSAGDVNGDGRSDLVLGAPQADNNGRGNSGSAYVVFGKPSTAPVDLAALGEAGFRVDGAAVGDLSGYAVGSVDDLNGDGRPDVVVGAPQADNNGRANSGSAYVVFGKASTTTVDLGALGAAGFRLDGAVAGDSAGSAVGSAGDVNGDGRVDVVVGAPQADNNGRASSGSAYVVFGKASTTTVDLGALGAAGFRVDGGAADDRAGTAVAGAGDVNGDGRPDVIVGAPGANANGRADSGSASVVFGKASTTAVDLGALGAAGFRVGGAAANDFSGQAVASAGDVNGDGRPDVVVGAPTADNNGRSNSGSAYVVFGFGEPLLAYDPVIGSVGKALVAQGPKSVARTGEALFSVTPSLPSGLTLDPKTGVVSGTPSAAVAGGAFTVTMKDLVGQATAPLQLSVIQPDTKPPAVTLKAKPSQRIVKTKALFVAASCDEGCILTLQSVVTVKGVKGKVPLITAVRTLKSARATSFKVVFSVETRAQLAGLLVKGRTATVALTLVAKDASGNTKTRKLTVPVRA